VRLDLILQTFFNFRFKWLSLSECTFQSTRTALSKPAKPIHRKKSIIPGDSIKPGKTIRVKKSFTVNPQNIFTLKNCIKKSKKFEKLNIGWGRKILWRYFF